MNKPIFKNIFKTPYARKPLHVARAIDPNHTILPEFFDVCLKYVCVHHDKACIENLVYPPAEDQIKVLRNLHKLAMQTDIDGLQGTFIKLLVNKETNLLQILLDELKQMNEHLDNIRNMKDVVDNKFIGLVATTIESTNV